ncbi:MAG: ribosomal L7Ae/L30e/S12e/Gadd45 family protein [Gemmatimonadetes bacterium]|nr:ribosomal L7Ae/L30e/S12e/Gadd45 family protein [Gemmatimonadota bacterium]
MDDALRRRLLGLAGLGVRARNAVVGVDQVRAAAQSGALRVALMADDVSRHSRDKVVPMLTARRIEMVDGFTAAELGAVAGRDATAVIGIVDAQLAKGIRGALRPAGE